MKLLFSFLIIYSLATGWSLAVKSDLNLVSSLISDDESSSDSPSQYSYNPSLLTQFYQDDSNTNLYSGFFKYI